MSTLITCPAAPVATPRLRALMASYGAWRPMTGSDLRAFEAAAQHNQTEHNQDGRTAIDGAAYVTTTKQHFSIRSGPPPSRP